MASLEDLPTRNTATALAEGDLIPVIDISTLRSGQQPKSATLDLLAGYLADGGLAAGSAIVTTTTTVAAGTLVIPITHRYVAKTTGASPENLSLANGSFVGQRLNVRLVTDGGGAGTLTPTTKAGFTSVVLDDAGEFVELEWTTSGWIIVGIGGLTAQPTVNA
jgi:hypothetical protein